MIVTHESPDFDAIGAVWLLQRHGAMQDIAVVFVNTGRPDPDVLETAVAVVDTGRVFDPARLRFDHHQFPGKAASATCATQQVWEHLNSDGRLDFLAPLITLITAGDTGNSAANSSRKLGIHRLLSTRKARKQTDDELLAWGLETLDDLAAGLLADVEAAVSIDSHCVYRSADGLLLALDDAPQGATFAAYEQGVRVVIWRNTQMEGTQAIGVNRSGEWSAIHCGELVGAAMTWCQSDSPMVAEMETWYRHEAGFFAGRGTGKAKDPRPIDVSLEQVAKVIDLAWQR